MSNKSVSASDANKLASQMMSLALQDEILSPINESCLKDVRFTVL